MVNQQERTTFVTEVQREHERIDRQWMTLHYRTIVGIVIFGIIAELILAFSFYIAIQDELTISFQTYTAKFILRPILMNAGWLLVSVLGMHIRNIKTMTRVYILSVSLIGVCFVFYSVHYIFYISLIFFAPILLTSFYGEYKLTTTVTVLSLLAKLISDFFIFWDASRELPFESGYSLMRIIVSTLILGAFYVVSMIVISFMKKKNNAAIEIEKERIQMHRQLMTDPLTGINNRLALRDMFQAIENTASDTYFFAMIDLDNFKNMNDTYGHARGDECLQAIGKILSGHSSDDFMTFRFGGDEFCILFKNKTRDEVLWICKVIREEFKLKSLGELADFLTISIGIAEYERGMYVEDLMSNADKALYRAKATRDAISF